jgi:ubiquinone biosynthesis protein UbiJ
MSCAESTLNTLLRLDSHLRPGLTKAEFRRLFIKCDRCEVVMTRRVVSQHRCGAFSHGRREVIDLTNEN